MHVCPSFGVPILTACAGQTVEALGDALKAFTGGVIIVSHDERLICHACSELWVCENGTVRELKAEFVDYKKRLLSTLGMRK
jgi:ATPase subunit of ABC transporter with duplicated ATPase domains